MAKYYYNGVLLPEVPADVLAKRPYVWIRKNETSGYYDLFFSTEAFYVYEADAMSGTGITKPWYRVKIDGADEVESWTYYQESTANLTIDETRTALWANHDILNSKDAEPTDIYLKGGEPIPETYYLYGNYVLPPVPLWTGMPNYGIRRDEVNNRFDVFFTAGGMHFDGSAVRASDGVKCPRFVLPLDGSGQWEYFDTEYTGWTHTEGRIVFFTSVDVYNGTDTTEIWMAASTPKLPYDRKYLVRSGSTLYTVADGALSALTETEVTASLFQTYGVDDLPDGSLLVGLTDPEVLYWQDSTDELPTLSLTVKGTPPLPQIFTSEPQDLTHETIIGVDYAEVDASEDVRFAISFDGGTTWKAHDGTAWFEVSDSAPGMLAFTMNAITAEQWAEVVVLDSYMLRFWLPNTTAYVKSVVIHYINP